MFKWVWNIEQEAKRYCLSKSLHGIAHSSQAPPQLFFYILFFICESDNSAGTQQLTENRNGAIMADDEKAVAN